MLNLPPIEKWEVNFEADYYGASALIARKLSLQNTLHVPVRWIHGWDYNRKSFINLYSAECSPMTTIFLENEARVDEMRKIGFINSYAVGLPFIYADAIEGTVRIKDSLLVMPAHSTTHSKIKNYDLLRDFFINIRSHVKNYSKVSVCVSGSCYEDSEYMKFIKSFGFDVVFGAWIFDKNALVRMKTILSSFSAVISNSIGSHLIYAAYCGTRIIMVSPIDKPDYKLAAKNEPAYIRYPHLLSILEKHELENPIDRKFPILFKSNQNLDELMQWGRNELGESFKKEPEFIAELFGWKITRPSFKNIDGKVISHEAKLLPAFWSFPKKVVPLVEKTTYLEVLKPRLNLGCGSQVHSEWTNLDISPRHADVINHDLTKRLPFEDGTFEVVYHSHVLEHLTKEQGTAFMNECCRVLKPKGILRVVVPDLEIIARLYLENLDKSVNGDLRASERHEWMLLELQDQMVREFSGGEMGRYFQLNPMPAEDFVIERLGQEVLDVIKTLRLNPLTKNQPSSSPTSVVDPIQAARFRNCGEVHKWMYDRQSLRRLMINTGFSEISVKKAGESLIPEFWKYYFDRLPNGSTRKPDSLFMEAIKA
jgi:predicted SAM-dependent methyltransferase